jgi:hypothetical protein
MYPRAQSLIITKQVEDIYIYLVLLNATILPIRVLPVGKDQQRDDIIADNFLQMIACLAKHLWPNTNSVPTCKESVYTKKIWPGYIKTAKKKVRRIKVPSIIEIVAASFFFAGSIFLVVSCARSIIQRGNHLHFFPFELEG